MYSQCNLRIVARVRRYSYIIITMYISRMPLRCSLKKDKEQQQQKTYITVSLNVLNQTHIGGDALYVIAVSHSVRPFIPHWINLQF